MRGLQAWSCSIGYRHADWAQRTGCEPRRALQAAIPAYPVAPLFLWKCTSMKIRFLGLGGTDPVVGQLKRKNGCLFQQQAVSLAENAARFAARPARGFRSSSCQNANKGSKKESPPVQPRGGTDNNKGACLNRQTPSERIWKIRIQPDGQPKQ